MRSDKISIGGQKHMDAQVLRAQQWLNQNYGDNPLFSGIDEDGITGSFMFSALTEAWQIETSQR